MPDEEIHIHVHVNTGVGDEALAILRRLDQQGIETMADLSALTAEVEQNSDAVGSAVALLGSLSQQIRDAATDPAAIQALADELDSNTQALADAVAANTPAAPEAPAEGGGAEEAPPAEEPPSPQQLPS